MESMNRKDLLFSLIFLVVICCAFFLKPGYRLSAREQASNIVTKKVATQLSSEKKLLPCGSGGQISHGVKKLSLSFFYREPIEIEQGRELLIAGVNKFVAAVNADEHIRPYLVNYPFEPKNVEILIFLQNPDGSEIIPGKLTCMGATEGVLTYDIEDPETQRLVTIHKESYEEALLKISEPVKKAS